jgi:hypothetical protein
VYTSISEVTRTTKRKQSGKAICSVVIIVNGTCDFINQKLNLAPALGERRHPESIGPLCGKICLDVLDENPLHMLALQQLRYSLYDIAAEVKLDRYVGILMRLIDSGTDGELYNVAVKQHCR